LPVTGGGVGVLVAVAVALLAAGGCVWLLARRRRA
jgi:LPXTG-motif cell wall-anchored protein